MIDKYIILNRRPNFVVKLFIYNIIFLTGLVIFGINTLLYQSYYQFHSQILNLDSYYFLEVLVPVKEVNKVTKQNQLWINSKEYNYQVFKIDEKVSYRNGENYIKVYLDINHLDQSFQKDEYHINVKIKKDKKTIIDYLKDKKEE